MKRTLLFILFFCRAVSSPAQLTRDQKISDFLQLAGLYAKNYGPYEWKRDALKFDALNVSPWLDRISQSKDDLDFYEICVDYVAGLNDAHDGFRLPSNFTANLGFTVDIYDGKVLVDSINRSLRPADQYQFQTGDEVVSVDGKTAEEWIQAFSKYAVAANSRSTRRVAASLITLRPQQIMPRAHEIGDIAIVLFRRQNGDLEYYGIPWIKTGVPITSVGPVPSPRSKQYPMATASPPSSSDLDPDTPSYMIPLLAMQNLRLPDSKLLLGEGALQPLFAMPDGFVQRLGRGLNDNFFSGTFQSGGFKIGFLRIPQMSPFNGLAIQQFESEMAFFQDNTDGLIIDEMRNPGGSVTYTQQLLQRLIPYQFRTLGFEIRATSVWVASLAQSLDSAKRQNAPQWMIDLYSAILKEVEDANRENRGRTGPLPLSSPTLDLQPATDRTGKVIAYSKALMLLADEFSASGADFFAAVIQDNQRGPMFGMRTMGAGGNVFDFSVCVYSEGAASVTGSLMNRKSPIVTDEYPAAPYVENIGVRPDIVMDYMTKDNLLNRGRPFVDAFAAAMVDYIRSQQQ